MSPDNRPILITGLHRFGNSWVGDTLGRAPGTLSTGEVFNPLNSDLVFDGFTFELWYQYICAENESAFLRPIANRMFQSMAVREVTTAVSSANARNGLWRRFKMLAKKNILGYRLVYKDPICFFSVPWLHKNFATLPVVLVRHPAAFAASLMRVKWGFDFNNLLSQPLLMKNVLAPWRHDIEKATRKQQGIIEDAILLWRIFRNVIDLYESMPRLRNDLIIIRHEDLSANPMQGFQNLFSSLELQLSDSVKAHIVRSTESANPVRGFEDVHVLNRDSRKTVEGWKERLSLDEIRQIRTATEEAAQPYYGADDW